MKKKTATPKDPFENPFEIRALAQVQTMCDALGWPLTHHSRNCIVDILVALLFKAERDGLDFETMLQSARGHFRCEAGAEYDKKRKDWVTTDGFGFSEG